MMAVTDRHFRSLLRLISRHTLLFSEMIHARAIVGKASCGRYLDFDRREKPVVLQLGGCEPAVLSEAARIAADRGYTEINLNAGCPSPRVTSGRFGASLMLEPDLVARIIEGLMSATPLPVSVKCRTGIDALEERSFLHRFVAVVANTGCKYFIIHARKALLNGISARENRTIPPLRHELVHELKSTHPYLHITINGGINTLDAAEEHLGRVDGVMIGRAVRDNPWCLAEADSRIYGVPATAPPIFRADVARAYAAYVDRCLQEGVPLPPLLRAALSLFNGSRGAKKWRRSLSEAGINSQPSRGRSADGAAILLHALDALAE